jgi:hypothetical protein
VKKLVSVDVVINTPAHSVEGQIHRRLRAWRSNNFEGVGPGRNDVEWKYYLGSRLSSKYHYRSSQPTSGVESARLLGAHGWRNCGRALFAE